MKDIHGPAFRLNGPAMKEICGFPATVRDGWYYWSPNQLIGPFTSLLETLTHQVSTRERAAS